MELKPLDPPDNTKAYLVLSSQFGIGDLLLWIPEGISTNKGYSSIYPIGSPWYSEGNSWNQEVEESGRFGQGNFEKLNESTLECCGVRSAIQGPVSWTTKVNLEKDGVSFSITLQNLGNETLPKAAAPICTKFLQKEKNEEKNTWWTDEKAFVRSNNQIRPLNELGMDGGLPNNFQAYMLQGETFENPFMKNFWGFNTHTVDRTLMVTEYKQKGLCIGVESPNAYFLHCNRGNPCTDITVAFGDVLAGETAEATGKIWLRDGTPADFL